MLDKISAINRFLPEFWKVSLPNWAHRRPLRQSSAGFSATFIFFCWPAIVTGLTCGQFFFASVIFSKIHVFRCSSKFCKFMFCRVCGFRVRVWESYRTSRSSAYCGTGVHNLHKFRAVTNGAVPVPRVLWHGVYRTHKSSGYGYERPTELPEIRVRA